MKIKIDASIHLDSQILKSRTKRPSQRLRPLCIDVVTNNKDKILVLRKLGFNWKDIAGLLNISATSLTKAISVIMTDEEFFPFSGMKKNIDNKSSISKRDQYSKNKDVEIVLRFKEENIVSLAIR